MQKYKCLRFEQNLYVTQASLVKQYKSSIYIKENNRKKSFTANRQELTLPYKWVYLIKLYFCGYG